ncbi:MAG TPA: glycerate kinase [Epulopiscium sp.]|nr:glycerate kinase [Candidatus Epulonipiscium sp.]
MKIVIASDSYKGSLTAKEVGNYIEAGVLRFNSQIEVVKVPMADGGEGTVQSLVDATEGEIITLQVKDPLLRDIDSFYGILGDGKTAVIEMAAASGLPLLTEEEKDPLIASSYGTGQLIKDALDRGCRRFIIGLGGSATNDAGAGMLKALGVIFKDDTGQEIPVGGIGLLRLKEIDMSNMDIRIKASTIKAACDVDNKLYGLQGASYIFGPQKGADEIMVQQLDKALMNFAQVVSESIGMDVSTIKGGGAAGGLGSAMVAFLNAKLEKGVDIVIEQTQLHKAMENADLVITGEGMIDYQTKFGKTPYGVAQVAKELKIPVIAIAGGIGNEANILYEHGFDSIFSIVDKPMTLDESVERCGQLLEDVACRIIRVFMLNSQYKP